MPTAVFADVLMTSLTKHEPVLHLSIHLLLVCFPHVLLMKMYICELFGEQTSYLYTVDTSNLNGVIVEHRDISVMLTTECSFDALNISDHTCVILSSSDSL